jgi:archaellum component FlaC
MTGNDRMHIALFELKDEIQELQWNIKELSGIVAELSRDVKVLKHRIDEIDMHTEGDGK